MRNKDYRDHPAVLDFIYDESDPDETRYQARRINDLIEENVPDHIRISNEFRQALVYELVNRSHQMYENIVARSRDVAAQEILKIFKTEGLKEMTISDDGVEYKITLSGESTIPREKTYIQH